MQEDSSLLADAPQPQQTLAGLNRLILWQHLLMSAACRAAQGMYLDAFNYKGRFRQILDNW